MKGNASIRNDYAVSEVVGGMILILVAVLSFAVIYTYLFPSLPETNANTKLAGYVTDEGIIVLKHIGGNSINSYTIEMRYVNNNSLIEKNTYTNDPWTIGTYISPFTSQSISTFDNKVLVRVIGNIDGEGETLFEGILMGKGLPIHTLNMLIPSLWTNTPDEDLICFNYSITPNIDAETYIYSWLVNGVPLAEIIWSFDTNSPTVVKDYSGNGYDGTVIDAIWTPDGIIGGAYYFDGGGDHITRDLPNSSVFNEIYRNDFTISIWIKSDDIDEPHKVVLETGENNENFVKIIQHESQLHFGVYVNKGKLIESVVGTNENLSSNIWYHLVGTWDADQEAIELFLNGTSIINSTDSGRGVFSHATEDGKLDVGCGGGFWQGYLDEFQVYPRILSREQIYQLYLCTKDGNSNKMVIVSDETNVGEIWQCVVTPNSGTEDDESVGSNEIIIVDYAGGG